MSDFFNRIQNCRFHQTLFPAYVYGWVAHRRYTQVSPRQTMSGDRYPFVAVIEFWSGPCVLRKATFKCEPIVKGKRVTSFTNSEEDAVQLTMVMPFLVACRAWCCEPNRISMNTKA